MISHAEHKAYLEQTEAFCRENCTEEAMMERLRSVRDILLKETDIYALADRTMSDEMKTYRQALRDLPSRTTNPENPSWPTKPS